MNADGGQAAGKPPKTKNLPQSHLEIPKQPNDVYNLPSQHHNHQQQQQQLQSQLLGSSGGKGNAATSGTDALNNAPSYRWVGAGTNLSDGTIEYYTLEVNAAGRVSSVRVGDSVLLFSGDLQDEGVEVDSNAVNEDDKEHAKFEKGPLSETSLPSGDGRDSNNVVSSLALSKKVNQDGSAGISDGSDVNIDENFFGVKALNPFVARIERMWEEPALGKTGRHRNPPGTTFCGFVTDNARKLRMKIKARWYFKVNYYGRLLIERECHRRSLL